MDGLGGTCYDMLAVVEDQERLAAGQELAEPFQRAAGVAGASAGAHAQRGGDGTGHARIFADRRELDQPHSVVVAAEPASRRLDRQPGLAHAARADDGHNPAGLQQGGDRVEFGPAPDKRRRCRREVAGTAPVSRGVTGRGRVQRRILAEHGALEPPQLRPRVNAELIGQHGPGPLIGPERVTLSPGPVQGDDQLPPQALPQRMRLRQSFEFSRQLTVPAEHQIRFDTVLGGSQARLLKTDDHQRSEPGIGELGQRRAAPQAKRPAQQGRRRHRVLPLQSRTALRHQVIEAGSVQSAGRHLKGIAAAARADAIAAQHPAEPGDLHLKTVTVLELLPMPHLVKKLIGRHRTAACQRQGNQECLRSQPADIQDPAVVPDDLEGPEDSKLHA